MRHMNFLELIIFVCRLASFIYEIFTYQVEGGGGLLFEMEPYHYNPFDIQTQKMVKFFSIVLMVGVGTKLASALFGQNKSHSTPFPKLIRKMSIF